MQRQREARRAAMVSHTTTNQQPVEESTNMAQWTSVIAPSPADHIVSTSAGEAQPGLVPPLRQVLSASPSTVSHIIPKTTHSAQSAEPAGKSSCDDKQH